MSARLDKVLTEDMFEAIVQIELFIQDMDEKAFFEDIKTQAAVERYLEILGEAANKLSDSFCQKYSQIQWHRIISLRNRIIHAYFEVSKSIVWNIIIKYLPELKLQINNILKEL